MKMIIALMLLSTSAFAQQLPTGPLQFVKDKKTVNVSEDTVNPLNTVGLPISGTIVATNPSVSGNNAPIPLSSTLIGGSDGGQLRPLSATTSGGVNYLKVDTSGFISIGAATSTNQVTGNNSLSSIDGKIPANLTVTSTRLLVDGSGVTQPISAASLPLPTGAATSTIQTDGSQKTKIVDGSGNVIGSISNKLQVIQPDGTASGTITSTQSVIIGLNGSGTVSVQLSGTWSGAVVLEGSTDGANWYSVPGVALTSGGVSSTFSSNNLIAVSVGGFENFRVRGNTVTSGTLTVSLHSNHASSAVVISNPIPSGTNTIGSINNISGTISLPTGASTSALQTTANNSLSSIDGKLTSVTVGTITGPVALPTGAATSALQTQISGQLPTTLGAKTTANSMAVNIASDQVVNVSSAAPSSGSGSGAAATVSTVITLTAPANATGFVLMNLDTSTANVRYAIGRTASATLGQQLQPGRDSGFIPCSANVSLIAESGTQNYDIQWIIK